MHKVNKTENKISNWIKLIVSLAVIIFLAIVAYFLESNYSQLLNKVESFERIEEKTVLDSLKDENLTIKDEEATRRNLEIRWLKTSLRYFQGKNVISDIEILKKIAPSDAYHELDKLSSMLKAAGSYIPGQIFVEFLNLKNNLSQKDTRIIFQGHLGKFLNKLVNVKKLHKNISSVEELDKVEHSILSQDYELAISQLIYYQKKCQCFDDKDFEFLKKQTEIIKQIKDVSRKLKRDYK